MTEIYLVRHGQASFGSDNYDKLSDLGHKQAIWLGDHFREKNMAFDQIVSGDLVRHEETARGILNGLNSDQDWHTLPGLNEFNFNSIIMAYLAQHPEQAPAADAPRSDYYRLLKKSMKAWANNTLEGELSETWDSFSNRVRTSFNHIQNNFHGDKVLVVSSGGVIAMMISQVLQSSADSVIELNLQTKNTSVSHFYFNTKSIRLTGFNHTPHLDEKDKQQYITFS